jgi:hypothetical protein
MRSGQNRYEETEETRRDDILVIAIVEHDGVGGSQVQSETSSTSRKNCMRVISGQRDLAKIESENEKRLAEDSNLGVVVEGIAKTLTFGNIRLSRQFQVLDVHCIEDDFENVENLSELTED